MRAAGMMLFIKSHEPDMLRLVCFVYTFCVALTTSDITWLSFFALTSVVAITHPGLVNPFHRSVDMSFTWFWQDHLGIHARVFLSLVYIASLEAARYWHCNWLNMGQPAMYDGPRPVVEFCFLVRLAVAAKGGFLVAHCYPILYLIIEIIFPNAPRRAPGYDSLANLYSADAPTPTLVDDGANGNGMASPTPVPTPPTPAPILSTPAPALPPPALGPDPPPVPPPLVRPPPVPVPVVPVPPPPLPAASETPAPLPSAGLPSSLQSEIASFASPSALSRRLRKVLATTPTAVRRCANPLMSAVNPLLQAAMARRRPAMAESPTSSDEGSPSTE